MTLSRREHSKGVQYINNREAELPKRALHVAGWPDFEKTDTC